MEKIKKIENIEDLVIELRGERVILDRDVAKIYGVETKRINEAVKNNWEKFPPKYIFELDLTEFENLRSKISTTKLNKVRVTPKAFTEKGIYMLATVLKSKSAISATFNIIETFAKIKELSRNVTKLTSIKDKSKQNVLLEKTGNIFADILDNNLEIKDSETSIELNLAVLKLKHVVKKKKE